MYRDYISGIIRSAINNVLEMKYIINTNCYKQLKIGDKTSVSLCEMDTCE